MPGLIGAFCIARQGDMASAQRAYQEVLTRDPAHADARYNMGMVQLCMGDYAEGFAQYEARWQTANQSSSRPNTAVCRCGMGNHWMVAGCWCKPNKATETPFSLRALFRK